MMSHDFDPWVEIERLRGRPAKVAKLAKPDSNLSHFSRFSHEDTHHRCARCRALSVQDVGIVRCFECGFVRPALMGRPSVSRPRRRSGAHDRLRLVEVSSKEAEDG